jgi:hypothetical protein
VGTRDLTVVLFIDALGTEVVKTHRFLAERPGHHHRLETVIGYSSSAIPSLLTGALPREHGHFSMYRRDLGAGVFRPYRHLMWFIHHTKGRGKLRAWLKTRLSRRLSGYFELYDLPLDQLAAFDLTQRRDIFTPGGLAPQTTFIDLAARSGVPWRVWSWKTPERRAFDELLASVRAGNEQFLLAYSAELDALMHRVGVGHPSVREKLGEYERFLDTLEREASGRSLRLFLFSDHGMTDVVAAHDVHGMLSDACIRVPNDVLLFTDSTMARFWFRDRGTERTVREALPSTTWGRWLERPEFTSYGIDFADHRYGEAIFLLEPGHVIAPSFMGQRPCAAMHGYGPEDATCKAWLFASDALDPAPTSILELKALFAREIERLAGSAE